MNEFCKTVFIARGGIFFLVRRLVLPAELPRAVQLT